MKKGISNLLVFSLALVMLFVTLPATDASASTKINSAVSWALGIAGNSKHGYDQTRRWGPDYDCSSLVITAYQNAGVPVKSNGASYTGNMYSAFIKSGFSNVRSKINLATGSGLRKGDVLLNPGSHTVMVSNVSGSSITIVHASINEKGTATGGRTGDQTGKEICTRSYYNKNWTYILRHSSSTPGTPAPTPTPTKPCFPRYTGTSGSIVDALNAVGADSSMAYRTKIAAANGISNYSGTPTQNTQMLNLLKQGRLVKPGASVSYFARYTGTSGSIVNALNAIRVDSSYSYRTKIAVRNGISNYSGTPTQNTQMLNLLKQGRLIKP